MLICKQQNHSGQKKNLLSFHLWWKNWWECIIQQPECTWVHICLVSMHFSSYTSWYFVETVKSLIGPLNFAKQILWSITAGWISYKDEKICCFPKCSLNGEDIFKAKSHRFELSWGYFEAFVDGTPKMNKLGYIWCWVEGTIIQTNCKFGISTVCFCFFHYFSC